MDKAILTRVEEHLKTVIDAGLEWVGIFLQGSQNYGLDYEQSDVDTKVIVLPNFDDFVLNRKPKSYTHIMENDEHCDVKDIRLMFECFKKQNINFVEILFSPYVIISPKYDDLFRPVIDARESIAHYNNYAAVKCMLGMALDKQKAMEHPYPATLDKIERFGYDPKQLHHAVRMLEFLGRYISGEPYSECLRSKNPKFLKDIKRGCLMLDEARAFMNSTIRTIKQMEQDYLETHPLVIDRGVEKVLNKATYEILRRHFVDELSRSV